ncbi:unnamed protein product [Cyprideis torosa]|uniref:Uncharacterized protein n=1 Tax=Cyprideis torosa TaxID=163714 RepID=A0A7R8ZMU8_9CRUS|nr:unnamed protein product [Cyprideis torosa]CAG0885192.1 unnamed protein product [Cyprideis torosa]
MPATSRLLDGYRNSGSLSNGSSCTDSEGKSKYSLEDIIYEMSTRDPTPEGGSSSVNGSNDDEDVYTQLADKERDLILAAELGKALLEKNEELSRENERIAEDFSQQLESCQWLQNSALVSVLRGSRGRALNLEHGTSGEDMGGGDH